MSNANRAHKALRAAFLDWAEAEHYFPTACQRERHHAKRSAKRAQRRLDKALVAETAA